MRKCRCKTQCRGCRGLELLQADYESARLRLEVERRAVLAGPLAQRIREWALESSGNAESAKRAFELLS
jgi:hypothetical protein